MDFMVSGIVVNGQSLDYHNLVLSMEPDSTTKRLDEKTKEELKREKNRESSARSRQRKRSEDEENMREIKRLKFDNVRLKEIEDKLLEEGRALREKVHPDFLTQPYCRGCYPKETNEPGEGTCAEGQETNLPSEIIKIISEMPGSSASMVLPQELPGSSGFIAQAQEWQGNSCMALAQGLQGMDQAQGLQGSGDSMDQGEALEVSYIPKDQVLSGNIDSMDQAQAGTRIIIPID